MFLRHHRTTTALALLSLTALTLTGCAAADEPAAGTAGSTSSGSSAAESVTVTDPWVKAADEGMSAAFGEITNAGNDDVTIVSATSEAAGTVELHETVDDGTGAMTMQEIDGGFVVGPGETLALEPGGNHLMLMDLTDPLEAGEEVTVTLTFSDDSTAEITAPVKDYSGANESYSGDDSDMDMDGTEHDHEHTVDEDA
jgi:copper(I)-binding protein